MPEPAESKRMSDEAVQAKTGKTWTQWFAILDKAGGARKSHKEIVALLDGYDIGGWWQQMLTVVYEQERGLREKHQTATGYQVSVSKTLPAGADQLFECCHDPKQRKQWAPGMPLSIRKATPGKSLRMTATADNTNVEINLYPKGDAKAQIVVQHNKLRDASQAADRKAYWARALARLSDLLA